MALPLTGVSFQPSEPRPGYGGPQRPSGNPVQEAIKVLSLRLPRTVGARPVAPAPLLTAPGGAGNPRVDSIVQQVLAKMFGGQQGMTPAPTQGPFLPSAPSFSGGGQPGYTQPPQEDFLTQTLNQRPRFTVDLPPSPQEPPASDQGWSPAPPPMPPWLSEPLPQEPQAPFEI